MITRIPDTVQQAWGEVVAHDFTTWLEEVMADETVRRDDWREDKIELSSLGTRMTIVEHDLAELKTELREFRREVNERFDRLGERIDGVIAQLNERFDRQNAEFNARFERQNNESNARFDQLQRQITAQTRWTMGTLAVFCTLVTVMLAISQLRP